MTATSSCPRCSGPLRAPGLMSSDWTCAVHGAVEPYAPVHHPSPDVVRQLAARAQVPLWAPQPLLPGWTMTGLATAGDARSGARASVLALSGPCPLGGPADLLLIAEEPGVGLGARYAGLDVVDPGPCDGVPDGRVLASGHPTPLWACASPDDRVALVGEAGGVWLWMVLWPPAAELVLLEHLELHDLRAGEHAAPDLPLGAPSPRLLG